MNEEENDIETTTTTESTTTSNGEVERKGFNITSLVLGIISIVGFCFWYLAIPSAIIAIIFGVAGRKDAGHGMGIAGMVLGIIGLILTLLWIFVLASILVAAGAYGY